MALQQYRIGGTYYGYDPSTGQLIAFANEQQFNQHFSGKPDPNAPQLPIDPSTANSQPGQMVSINQSSPVQQTTQGNSGTGPTATGFYPYQKNGQLYAYNPQTGQSAQIGSTADMQKYFGQSYGTYNGFLNEISNPNSLPSLPQAGGTAGGTNQSSPQFSSIVKTVDSPQVYGQLQNGQWIAFNDMSQLPPGVQIQTVGAPPTGAISYNDFYPLQSSTSDSFDPTKYGLDMATWNSMDNASKAFFEATASLLQSQYNQGQSNVSINQDLLNKALVAAQNDPNIQAKYGDALKLGQNSLTITLGQLNSDWNVAQTQQQQELQKQQKDLQEAQAAAGTAYSGYRTQAQNLLNAQQNSVIQSSRSQLQSNLNSLGQTFESQFGSAALASMPGLSVGGIAYNPVGGITGTNPISQQQDVLARQQQIFQNEKL